MEPANQSEASSGAVNMDLEPERIPRRKEPINLLTGIFYKCVYFLESELTKCVILAFVKNRGNSLGLLFKGRKGAVFFSHDTFNEFASHINEITVALEKPEMYLLKGENFHIKVLRVFGKHHVFLYDGEHTLSLNSSEWTQFVNNLPAVYRELRNRFLIEDIIINYIINILDNDNENITVPIGLSPYVRERIFDEVELYKRWPNAGRS